MPDKEKIQAYSPDTNTTYEDWDALVAAESGGWIVTAVISKGKKVWTWSKGPYAEKRLATNAKQRLKNQHKRNSQGTELLTITVRPLWKDYR